MRKASALASELSVYHGRARGRGVNVPVLVFAHVVLRPLVRVYFRLRRTGQDNIPAHGSVILACNHRSFLDPFVVAACARRPVYFVAKKELFERRLIGWLLNALGAFPIRRGESDEQAMATARTILERGDALLIFPEGTRVRSGPLSEPRRGVGRLALETGAPVVAVAVFGTDRTRRGWRIRPCRVSVRCGRPLTFPRVENPSPKLAREVTARVWACVELQWEWLGGVARLRTAAVIGAGPMGRALATLLVRAGLDVQLGCRTRAQVDVLRAGAEAGGSLLGGARPTSIDQLELGGVDLVVLALPASALPGAVAQLGERIGERTAVATVSKGIVAPLGMTASSYVRHRTRARAVASVGGPAHAREAVEQGASVVVASGDQDVRAQIADALKRAGLIVEETDDVIGTELAGCAKNAAALAGAAAAAAAGMNAAGAAAGSVFGEIHQLAIDRGGRSETFAGLAGAGDLVATILAEGSRNRRAGELLGRAVPARQIRDMIDGTVEALDAVPLLVESFERAGLEAPATVALAALIAGRIGPEEWIATVCSRPVDRARRAA